MLLHTTAAAPTHPPHPHHPAAEMAVMMWVRGRADLGLTAVLLKALPLALGLAALAKAVVDRGLHLRFALGVCGKQVYCDQLQGLQGEAMASMRAGVPMPPPSK